MPISPAYEWSETALTLTVKAECRGATSSATDVYSSPHYVSANAPPYFLELDLHGAIDGTRSVANVSRGVVSLKLFRLHFVWRFVLHSFDQGPPGLLLA